MSALFFDVLNSPFEVAAAPRCAHITATQQPGMTHKAPLGYEKKFADFIRMCGDSKAKGVKEIVVANPVALVDNYEEVTESLSRLADAGLSPHIASRQESSGRNNSNRS